MLPPPRVVDPDGYNFYSPENAAKWEGVFDPLVHRVSFSLAARFARIINCCSSQVLKNVDESFTISADGLKYMERLNISLLSDLVSKPFSTLSFNTTMGLMTDIDERVRKVLAPMGPDPLIRAKDICRNLNRRRPRSARFGGSSSHHGTGTITPYFNNNNATNSEKEARFGKLMLAEIFEKRRIDQSVINHIESIIESIATDVLQLTARYVRNIKSTLITGQDINTAMHVDKLLMDLFQKDDDDPPTSASFCDTDTFFDSDNVSISNTTSITTTSACEQPEETKVDVDDQPPTYAEEVQYLIQKEKRFLDDLNLIIKVFHDPLVPVISPRELASLFGNIQEVYEFSYNFLGALEDAVEVANDETDPAIAACFEEFAEAQEFDVFEKYAQFVSILDFMCYLL